MNARTCESGYEPCGDYVGVQATRSGEYACGRPATLRAHVPNRLDVVAGHWVEVPGDVHACPRCAARAPGLHWSPIRPHVGPVPAGDLVHAAVVAVLHQPVRKSEVRYLLWQALYGYEVTEVTVAMYDFDRLVDDALPVLGGAT